MVTKIMKIIIMMQVRFGKDTGEVPFSCINTDVSYLNCWLLWRHFLGVSCLWRYVTRCPVCQLESPTHAMLIGSLPHPTHTDVLWIRAHTLTHACTHPAEVVTTFFENRWKKLWEFSRIEKMIPMSRYRCDRLGLYVCGGKPDQGQGHSLTVHGHTPAAAVGILVSYLSIEHFTTIYFYYINDR